MKNLLVKSTIVLTAVLSVNAYAALTAEQEQQLQEINALLEKNPKIIANLHQSLIQFTESKAQFLEQKKKHEEWMNDTKIHSISGNPDGDVVIYNFTDYNCPYCKKLEVGLERLLEEYDSVKVINIYVPLQQQEVEGIDTTSAAFALKVWQQDPAKFPEVNQLLFAKKGKHTKNSLETIAKKTGTEQYLVEDGVISASLFKNYDTFSDLGLGGTPAIFIGEEVIPGYMPYEQLEELVQQHMD
ncbi:DsbA family protein [Vibrio sp. HN007]|uniref:DsbA family protein n=1 Tax=Vibrio iocasae TaxID=3098914 RepID=UPI0035D49998